MKDRLTLAQKLTLLENRRKGWKELYRSLFVNEWKIKTIVFSGPPGVGKSSILNHFVKDENEDTAFLLVDPSSSISGGAVLADRARFDFSENKEKPFTRSVASRGHHGGTTFSIWPFLRLFNSEKFEKVFIESVGVGQTSEELRGIADFLIIVLSPESGDAYQAVKAGLIEEADLIVINKSDRSGSESLETTIKTVTGKKVISISAKNNKNIENLKKIVKKTKIKDTKRKLLAETKDFATSVFLDKLQDKLKNKKDIENPLDFDMGI